MNKLLIKNGHLIDPANNIDGDFDIYIEDGKVCEIVPRETSFKSKKVSDLLTDSNDDNIIDATGLIVTPGLIDIHVHLREPGFEYKETIETGAKSGAAGGFTTLCAMANTEPVNDNESVTKYMLEKSKASLIDVLPIGAVTKGLKGQDITEMASLSEAGCCAFSDDGLNIDDAAVMRRAFEYSKIVNKAVITHSEDSCLSCGAMHEGRVSTKLGMPGIPRSAEDSIVVRDIEILRQTGGHLHVAHVSSAKTVDAIRRAKAEGLKVTGEAAPHHLFLTDEAVIEQGVDAKMSPPLREKEDNASLIEALKDGTIEAIATDHAPHGLADKDVEFTSAANGIVGLETSLGLSMKLVHDKTIPLKKLIELMSTNPASLLNLEGGSIQVGDRADITIIDTNKEWTVDKTKFLSKGRNTPFDKWKLKGKAIYTIKDGKVVYKD